MLSFPTLESSGATVCGGGETDVDEKHIEGAVVEVLKDVLVVEKVSASTGKLQAALEDETSTPFSKDDEALVGSDPFLSFPEYQLCLCSTDAADAEADANTAAVSAAVLADGRREARFNSIPVQRSLASGHWKIASRIWLSKHNPLLLSLLRGTHPGASLGSNRKSR